MYNMRLGVVVVVVVMRNANDQLTSRGVGSRGVSSGTERHEIALSISRRTTDSDLMSLSAYQSTRRWSASSVTWGPAVTGCEAWHMTL